MKITITTTHTVMIDDRTISSDYEIEYEDIDFPIEKTRNGIVFLQPSIDLDSHIQFHRFMHGVPPLPGSKE